METITKHAEFFDKNIKPKRMEDRQLHVAYGVVREKIVKEIFKEEEIRKLIKQGLDPYSAVEKLWAGR